MNDTTNVSELKQQIQFLQKSLTDANNQIYQLKATKNRRVYGETFDIKKVNTIIQNLMIQIFKSSIKNDQRRHDNWYDTFQDYWTLSSHVENPTDYYISRTNEIIKQLSPSMIAVHKVANTDAVEQLRYIADFMKQAGFKYRPYEPRWNHEDNYIIPKVYEYH